MSTCNQNVSQATVEAPARHVSPRYSVRETQEAFVVTAQVPGVGSSAIETTVDGETLTVHARRSTSTPESWVAVHRESSAADYKLVLGLGNRVNRDAVSAELSQGVLTLTLPKAETIKPRRIEIKG